MMCRWYRYVPSLFFGVGIGSEPDNYVKVAIITILYVGFCVYGYHRVWEDGAMGVR
jgi:hypothetical protein